jgi:hypothetical protein
MDALFLAYSLSGAAGIRASWVMLVVAWSVHFGYLHPASSLTWVGSWWIIAMAFVASLVDLVGDKVPILDHALQTVHLVLAPVVGGIAAMSGYSGDPVFSVLLGVLGGGNAFFLHSTKTGVRAASTATTLGVANPVISIFEDAVATLFIIVSMLAPALAAVLLLLATIATIVAVKKVATRMRAARGASRAVAQP